MKSWASCPSRAGGFEQSYNAQAGVDTEMMMVVTQHVSQACTDKREVEPTLEQIVALPAVLGEVHTPITDNGFFSQANVKPRRGGRASAGAQEGVAS